MRGRSSRTAQPYLVVYPFVKLRPWYALPEEDRQRAMDEHMRIGHEFESIRNHTTYSFGIDDQEFMTVFECNEPADFMHLMLTLRETEASKYTERDTPIFVGQQLEIREALDRLDGVGARVEGAPKARAAGGARCARRRRPRSPPPRSARARSRPDGGLANQTPRSITSSATAA